MPGRSHLTGESSANRLGAPPQADLFTAPARPQRRRRLARAKRLAVGRPLPTEQLVHERLGKPTALAVFASDNLSSSAYATEEILRVLLYSGVGVAAFSRVVPLTLAMLGVLTLLLFSYRQTIRAYPQAGGAYLVTRDNFGLLPAQVAGVALLTDYILTVSVSVSAGTAALTSLHAPIHPYRVPVALAFVALIAWGNLRGVRESGRVFSVPTYFFVAMMGTLLVTAFVRMALGDLPPRVQTFPLPPAQPLAGLALAYVVMKAFASGGAAVTGVEAISNGVPAFKPPEWRNAITTLMWMGALLGTMFFGLSILAAHLRIVPDPHEKLTVLAQIGRAAFGGGPWGTTLFVALQIATMLILVLAANTSFADFPRLASFQAGDRFLPRQLTRYGDRLVFSNGVVVLSLAAAVPIVVFQASVTRLIPLYAVGVFTSFTFSQLGMAKRHWVRREAGWRFGLAINGGGGLVSGAMTVIIAATKFAQGAWIILIVIPVMVAALIRVRRHYSQAARSLRDPARRGPLHDEPRQSVVIPVGAPGADDVYAVAYAERVFPLDIRLVHFAYTGTPGEILDAWAPLNEPVELRIRRGSVASDLRAYVRELRGEMGDDRLVNVLIPETVRHRGLRHLLGKYRVQRMKAALIAEADVIVTNVTHHAGYETLEPVTFESSARHATQGWHHVAVVLVSAVHNATARSLRYAESLRPDELQCLHVAVEPGQADQVRADWDAAGYDVPLRIIDSPYRQIARPVHEHVRAVLASHPKTFVTLVLPEFVVRRRWHGLLHNHTALTLKGTFLFEPSVVVSAVPYRL